jgi:hypothetical protein
MTSSLGKETETKPTTGNRNKAHNRKKPHVTESIQTAEQGTLIVLYAQKL